MHLTNVARPLYHAIFVHNLKGSPPLEPFQLVGSMSYAQQTQPQEIRLHLVKLCLPVEQLSLHKIPDISISR